MPGRSRHCGACGGALSAGKYEAFSVYREPRLNAGLQLLYRFCPKCWGGIEAALKEYGVERAALPHATIPIGRNPRVEPPRGTKMLRTTYRS